MTGFAFGSAGEETFIKQCGMHIVAVLVIFTLAHMPWEYWVMAPWAILSTLWFYYRRHLVAVVVLHAATNASILVFVALTSGHFPDGSGGSLSLWFFV